MSARVTGAMVIMMVIVVMVSARLLRSIGCLAQLHRGLHQFRCFGFDGFGIILVECGFQGIKG